MNNKLLTIEIINKILIMRPSHPVSLLLKDYITLYELNYDTEYNYDDFTFSEYTLQQIKYKITLQDYI